LSAARAELSVPVVAIGGITLENAPQLIAAGADLLAVISDVFAADQPEKRAAAYDELFRNVLCRRRTGP
jgi:thiamine-phosphate pyrophosphorylase